MKYTLEVQYQGYNIDSNEIEKLVKESLKAKKVPFSKVKDLKIYYVVDTKVIYYTGMYKEEEISGTIYDI